MHLYNSNDFDSESYSPPTIFLEIDEQKNKETAKLNDLNLKIFFKNHCP